MNHPLYAIHWVWSGKTKESKLQTIRDAIRFRDPQVYYTSPNLVSLDIEVPEVSSRHIKFYIKFYIKSWNSFLSFIWLCSSLQPFDGFNQVHDNETERMVQFHIFAANHQLRQVYYGFIVAQGLNRTLKMPKVGQGGQ